MEDAGLVPVAIRNFGDWYKESHQGFQLDTAQLALTALHMSFVFVKPLPLSLPLCLAPCTDGSKKRWRDESGPDAAAVPEPRPVKQARTSGPAAGPGVL